MDKNQIFEFIYELAFRDATIRNAFPKDKGMSVSDFQQKKKDLRNSLKNKVKEYIDCILYENKPAVSEYYILQVCKEGKKYGFTFGNAQKLRNMAAKYMFVICYDEPEKRERFKDCHCPMDGIMLQILKHKGKCKDIPVDFPWSKMELDGGSIPKEYKMFQNDVMSLCGENELPLEYDFEHWGRERDE